VIYIYRLLREGPVQRLVQPSSDASPNRPMSVLDDPTASTSRRVPGGE
jgi:hypothetical protein